MVKQNFEVFRKDRNTFGVIVKTGKVYRNLQMKYKRYPEDFKWKDGTEALFWIPVRDSVDLSRLLCVQFDFTGYEP